jgi:hypothetical protein
MDGWFRYQMKWWWSLDMKVRWKTHERTMTINKCGWKKEKKNQNT